MFFVLKNQTFLFYSNTEPQVHRIETKTAPKPSQPEVVLSDGKLICLVFCGIVLI